MRRATPAPQAGGSLSTPVPGIILVRDPGLAPGLCVHPKHVGRSLPMSLEWSGWRDSNSRFPAPEAGGLAATLQPEMFLGEFFVGIVVLGLLSADRTSDREIL